MISGVSIETAAEGVPSNAPDLARPIPTGKNREKESLMSDFKPGLEGVVAFETEIAEPDKEGGSLRYRGVDIEELVGHVSFGHVWGLLVDNAVNPGLPPAGPERAPAPYR